jgi:hypothetical protein
MASIIKHRRIYRGAILLCCAAFCIGAYSFAHAHGPNGTEYQYQPEPPGGAAATLQLPANDGAGGWATPNRNVADVRALWHVRAALNVAAIGCRGQNADALVENYNRLQLRHKAAIAASERAVISAMAGTAARDKLATQLYNFFAMPPVQNEFCPVAFAISANIVTLPSAEVAQRAPEYLAQLDAPFQKFYTAYAVYKRDMKSWATNNAGRPVAERMAPSESYKQKMAAYTLAQEKYEADKRVYAVAYAKWQSDATACKAGDRKRCAQTVTTTAGKPATKVAQK